MIITTKLQTDLTSNLCLNTIMTIFAKFYPKIMSHTVFVIFSSKYQFGAEMVKVTYIKLFMGIL